MIEQDKVLKDQWAVCLIIPNKVNKIPNPWTLNTDLDAKNNPNFQQTTESKGKFFGTTSVSDFANVEWFSFRVTNKPYDTEELVEWVVFHRWSQIEAIFKELFIEDDEWKELMELYPTPKRQGAMPTSPFPLSLIRDMQMNPDKPYNVSIPDSNDKIPTKPNSDDTIEIRLEWTALFWMSYTNDKQTKS